MTNFSLFQTSNSSKKSLNSAGIEHELPRLSGGSADHSAISRFSRREIFKIFIYSSTWKFLNWIGWLNKKRIFGINKNLKNSYWIRDNERKSSLWPRLLIDGRIETICGGVAFNHLSMSLRPLPFVFCLSILSIYLFIFKNDFISTGFYVVNIHPLRRALTNTHTTLSIPLVDINHPYPNRLTNISISTRKKIK